MVKIIREGKKPRDVEHKIECHYCRTLFSFLASEAEVFYDLRDGGYLIIDCPKCGTICTKGDK